MSNRYGGSFRNGVGYGSFGGRSQGGGGGGAGGGGGGGGGPQQPVPRESDDDYDPYGDGYASGGYASGYGSDRYGGGPRGPSSRPAPPSGNNRSGGMQQDRQQERAQQSASSSGRRRGDSNAGGGGGRGDGASGAATRDDRDRPRMRMGKVGEETNAERQINRVLEVIKEEWPSMSENESVPVQLAVQLLDNSSVGRAHEYRKFQKTHAFLQEALKNIVHEHHQGFNSSIGTFHKIQGSIQASQKRVRSLKDSLAASRTSLCATDPELKKLYTSSQMYDDLLQTLNELEELRQVPDQLEARISEKRFLTAVEVLQTALRKLMKPELDDIGALGDLRSYLANQETALMDILVEELHEHLYLKSPYCQERWQNLTKNHGTFNDSYADSSAMAPFHQILDSIDLERPVSEDPAKNPEADTFYYVGLVVEALNKLGRLEAAVDTLKQRLPVELNSLVLETINEVDQRHPSSLRGSSTSSQAMHVYSSRETQMRADVIYDLLWTLYGKFEAIAEGHRVFHDSIKALIRREGAGNNSALLGSFKELWSLYQSEIKKLLHSHVTTDADVYQFSSSPKTGASGGPGVGGKERHTREHLFKFSEADAKSVEMVTEYDALEGIIRSAVPGLTSQSKKAEHKKASLIAPRTNSVVETVGSRRSTLPGGYDAGRLTGAYKALVEPSVFNMSLLLPPTLVFLQRLKGIVPPGSDLATSTLTTFLDNFLVNIFQPQLDETLGKLSDTVFGESDSFIEDPDWSKVARRPVFKGATQFFSVVTAFCRMLTTIPYDQALSSLIITQMMRYYERCMGWYKSLVAKAQESVTDAQYLRYSALLATEPGDLHDLMKKLCAVEKPTSEDLEEEVELLIYRTNENRLTPSDVIQDRDTISSLCLVYTSMKWLSVKIAGLRHIIRPETDALRATGPKPQNKRWTLLNDPSKAASDQGPVYLPMVQETVKSFDSIVSSYEDLSTTVLLTLHAEIRCQIIHSLAIALSPETAPYLLREDVSEPDPTILALNAELVVYDETVVRFLRQREADFVRKGLGLLINSYLVSQAKAVSPMNSKGSARMQLNILVLQQNLKNVEEGVDLARAANYYALFDRGPDAVVDKAKQSKDKQPGGKDGGATDPDSFTYDELVTLMELCYSEQTSDPERGIAAAAKRQMADKMLGLSEHMWQT